MVNCMTNNNSHDDRLTTLEVQHTYESEAIQRVAQDVDKNIGVAGELHARSTLVEEVLHGHRQSWQGLAGPRRVDRLRARACLVQVQEGMGARR